MLVDELEVNGRRLTATGGIDAATGAVNDGVLLVARETAEHDPNMKVSAYPKDDALKVIWPNPWHQWAPYSVKYDLSPAVDLQASWQVMFALRRLLTVFHSSVKDDPSLYGERLERFAVGENKLFAATLDALLDLGVVAREGALYRLRLARLAEFGVSWVALRGPNFADALRRLHADVCKHDVVLPLLSPGKGGSGRAPS